MRHICVFPVSIGQGYPLEISYKEMNPTYKDGSNFLDCEKLFLQSSFCFTSFSTFSSSGSRLFKLYQSSLSVKDMCDCSSSNCVFLSINEAMLPKSFSKCSAKVAVFLWICSCFYKMRERPSMCCFNPQVTAMASSGSS